MNILFGDKAFLRLRDSLFPAFKEHSLDVAGDGELEQKLPWADVLVIRPMNITKVFSNMEQTLKWFSSGVRVWKALTFRTVRIWAYMPATYHPGALVMGKELQKWPFSI